MKTNVRLSFLMSSCDSYEDLWYPFYECVDKFWPDCPYPLYLNTEHKQFREGGKNVVTFNQKGDKKLTWSERLRDVLLRIPTDYVFLVLDDFFLSAHVDTRYFEYLLDMMDADTSIPSIQLYGTRMIQGGEPIPADGTMTIRNLWPNGWATHFVPTIWRKDVLLKWLRPWESIWGFESYGSARARRKGFTSQVKIVSAPAVYEYLWVRDCSAVVHSKWLDEPGVTDFFVENGISIDYSVRPKITYEDYQQEGMASQLNKYSLWQIILKAFNYFRSRF